MLEENADAIRAELEAIRPAPHPEARGLLSSGSWRQYALYRHGYRLDEHCARCPTTTLLVDAIPGADSAGLVYFSVLDPHTHVVAHAGPTNLRIRCHLPLMVPDGCALRVGKTWRAWREGKCLVFDDSFVHEADNPTDRERIVLIVDVWHPDLTPAERTQLGRAIRAHLEQRTPQPWRPSPRTMVGATAAFADVTCGRPGARR